MADRKGRPQQQGWSALTNAQRENPYLQYRLLPSFTRELPAPDPSQFPLLSLHPQSPSPATIPNRSPSYNSSSPSSECSSGYGKCSHGSDAIAPLDSHALAVSRLHARHSWADLTLISDILQAVDLDEDSTSAYLFSMAPNPSQFAPLSLHPQLPSPATIPSSADIVKQHYEAIPHPPPYYNLSSPSSACGSYGECSHGSDAGAPLDSHALAVSRLHVRHSWADVALISDILQARDLSEDSTSAYLFSMADDNMNRVSAPDDAERPLWTQSNDDGELSCAREETSLHSYAGQKDFGLDAEGRDSSGFLNPVPIEPEWEVDDIYLSTRMDALRTSRASGKHARGAYKAFMGGDHGKAKLLSKQAREERAEAEKLHAEAAKKILQALNGKIPRNLWHLDLHGLHVHEAVAALQQRLLDIESACFNPNHAQHVSPSQRIVEKMKPVHGPALHGLPFSQELKVITGVGNHSRGGGSLPMAIQNFLIQNRYKFDNSKPGVVAVRPKFKG